MPRIHRLLLAVLAVLSACTTPGQAVPMVAVISATGAAATALKELTVASDASMSGYRREAFGPSWTDDVSVDGGHNGCDTRNDVLRRDLSALIVKSGTQGCVALSGVLSDPYTGRAELFQRGADTSPLIQIDHVVALGNTWQTGAQSLSADQRQNLANDPLELLAVDGPTNQEKGDGDAATWLPPDPDFRCTYVARQIAVKARYRLWVTAAERDAMLRVLAQCPGQAPPTLAEVAIPAVARGP